MVKLLSGLVLAFCLWAGAGLAQAAPEPLDYERWTAIATRAEQVLSAGRAADPALEQLRTDLAGWRERLLQAQETGTPRIATLQAQLDALGPLPETGEEPEEIALRRAELTAQLAELRAPVQRAEEAYTRANGLILEIDATIRDRQTQALLSLGPSPLNPGHWAAAWGDMTLSIDRLWTEIQRNAQTPALQAELQVKLPRTLLLTVLGLMLVLRGHRWAQAAVRSLRGSARRGGGFWRMLLSLGQVLLPLAGLYALSEAALDSGMLGPRWRLLLEDLPIWAAVLLGVRWLADVVFHEDDDIAILDIEAGLRLRARSTANVLSLLFVLDGVLISLTQLDGYAPSTVAVLHFPLLLLSGLFLVRFGRTRLRSLSDTQDDVAEETVFQDRFASLLARVCVAVGAVGPVLAAAGYGAARMALVHPTMMTLALVGLVLVLTRFFRAFYTFAAGRSDTETDSLIPVLAGFVIAVAALPALALIWGARVADLTEIWAQVQEGFALGDRRISPGDFLVAAGVFAAGYTLTRLLQGGLRTSVLPRTRIEKGGQDALVAATGYVGILLAGLAAVGAGGIDLSSLAIVAGALSVGIGFGLQNIVSNFVSGIILLAERPISQGDWIEVGGQHGIVREISVRSTRIETFDRFDLIVPNADLVSGQVRNYTRGNLLGRIIVSVGVAYGNDTRQVEKILLRIARDHPMVLMNPAPFVYFKGFGADSLDFEIRAVLRDVNASLAVRTEMNHQIVEQFAEAGIEIPFAQRDIWLRNPEALAEMAKIAPEEETTR